MKRLIKWFLIIGSVCCVLGIGTITAGAMMGGHWHLKDHLDRINRSDGISQAPGQSESDSSSQDAVLGSEKLPLASGATYDGVRRLSLEMVGNRVEIKESDELSGDTIIIGRGENAGISYRIRQEGDELKLEAEGDFSGNNPMEPLLIDVPREYVFDELEIENRQGSFYADVLHAAELSVECRSGDVFVGSGTVNRLDVECAAGSVLCQAAADGKVDVDCKAGDVQIMLSGAMEHYDYEMECTVGEILLDGKDMHEYAGHHGEHHMNHHTGRSVDLECSTGTIAVNFQEPAL